MKSSRRHRFFSSAATATTTVVYTFQNDNSAPQPDSKLTELPIASAPNAPPISEPIPITVHLPAHPRSLESSAAIKIQAAYRSHVVRTLVTQISAVNSEAKYWQRLIQRQLQKSLNATSSQYLVATNMLDQKIDATETVDAVRTNARERIKINEALMGLLFRLDAVPGLDPSVRELRRHVSRKIVGLQEILDAVSDTRVEHWDGYLRDWDDLVAGIEQEVCTERGGGKEMEMFCAEHLGFQCLQRFLRDQ